MEMTGGRRSNREDNKLWTEQDVLPLWENSFNTAYTDIGLSRNLHNGLAPLSFFAADTLYIYCSIMTHEFGFSRSDLRDKEQKRVYVGTVEGRVRMP